MAKSTGDAAWQQNTSLNGHMFSYLSKEGKLALRLPAEAREAFLKKYKSRLCAAYGVVQVEYVEVPDALLQRTQELGKFFDISYKYVGSLKPKPALQLRRAGLKPRGRLKSAPHSERRLAKR